MLNYLLTSVLPPFVQTKQSTPSTGNHLLNALGYRQALMESDCLLFHMQLSHHAVIHMMRTKTTNFKIQYPKLYRPHKLGRQLSHTLRQGTDVSWVTWVNNLAKTVTFTTLVYIYWTHSTCWPGPHLAQGMLHSWEFYLVLLQSFVLCKIETVCGTCMLHSLQKPFSPHPLFKTFI